MPKLGTITPRRLIALLKQNGFEVDRGADLGGGAGSVHVTSFLRAKQSRSMRD